MLVSLLSILPPVKGGISKYTAALLQGLSVQPNCSVDVLSFKKPYPERLYPGGTKDESLQSVNLPHVRVRTFLTWYNPFSWIYAGASTKGKILHVQWWIFVLAPIFLVILFIAKLLRRKKIVITVHNVKPHEQSKLRLLADRCIYAFGDHFIVHSESNKREFIKIFKIAEQKISVVPLGALVPDAPLTGISKAESRKKLRIPDDAKVVLFFGIIRPYKGLKTLLDAFAIVQQAMPKARLVVAGKPWEPWAPYQESIEKHNLSSSVIKKLDFIPEDEIEVLFSAADLVVLPYSHFDAQSAAGTLALPFGKALLVTDTGGLPQLVSTPQAVVPPDDPVQLSKRITTILTDGSLRHRLEQDSLQKAGELSWESIGKQTVEVYQRLSS